jgi:hypothetical protein
MTDVFVSYKRENKPAVQRVVEGLRGAGLSVWWDQDIAPDAPWEATIEAALEAAKVVIVAWSEAAVASENVKAEARRARGRGKLIQIFVEPCEPPLFFGERQGVDLSAWSGDADDHRFQTVLEAVRAVRDGRRPPQGVGYAPRKRNPWALILSAGAILSGVLALIANLGGARDAVCSLEALAEPCARYGLVNVAEAPAPAPTPDPDAILADARAQLLAGLNGTWSRSERDCAVAMTIAVDTDAQGVSRVRVTADGFESVAQVISAEGGAVVAQGVSEGAREIWTYRPNGDRLTAAAPDGVETALTRCAGG